MPDLSRREFVSLAAMAPLAGGILSSSAASAVGGVPGGRPTVSEAARQRIQQLHLPNVPLVTHEGKPVRFYDDLVKNKIVTINFFFGHCDEICPLVTANLVKVQKLLGDRVGRDIFMNSITLKPEEDNPAALKKYMKKFNARPVGWTFLTGQVNDIEYLRKSLGFTYPEPAIDRDKTQHIGNVRYGNEPLMLWAACPGMANPAFVAESLSWVIQPNRSAGEAL